ncbi:MAG: hypothetical protein ACRD19_06230 [Terriglobia bacterium]
MRGAKHLNWAKNNENLADTFDPADSFNVDWAITILFYAAVHYIDAYLAARGRRAQAHDQREREIADDPILAQVWENYRQLKRMSRDARYEMAEYRKNDLEKARLCLEAVKHVVIPRVSV